MSADRGRPFDRMSYANIHDDCIPVPDNFHANVYEHVVRPASDHLTQEEYRRFFTDQGHELPDEGEPSAEEFEDLVNEIEESFIPISSWIWPVHISVSLEPQHLQAMLHLYAGPVCLVEIDNSYYLGLTGAGMDLSWDLAKAYLLLGNYPPGEIARALPNFAGMGMSSEKHWVMQGCLGSMQALADFWTSRLGLVKSQYEELIVSATPEAQPGTPLPILYDWLLEQGREQEATNMETALEFLGYRKQN